MFRYISTKIRVLGSLNNLSRSRKRRNKPIKKIPESAESFDMDLRKTFDNCSNFVCRSMVLNEKKFVIAYIDNFIDYQRLDSGIIKPILDNLDNINERNEACFDMTFLKNKLLLPCELIEIEDMNKVIESFYAGYCVLFIDNESKTLGIKIKGVNKRDVSQPAIDNTVRGPKEGFGESASVNLSLITKIIKNPQLKSELIHLGNRTRTSVYICYLDGVANQNIISEVKQRLAQINVDAVLESNYISEYISDNPYTLFPLSGTHERPDIIAAQILEGRIAILCDGSPMVITIPYLFIETIQNSEDYFNKSIFASLVRISRLIALGLTTLLPGLYIIFLNFHHEVTPLQLLITAASGQEEIPLSSLLELLLLLTVFEILREASMRMPKGVGQTVSIVGALVLGDAAVKAGFVSNLVVMIVALTAICSFVNSSLLDTVSILRILFIFIADIFGFAGIIFTFALLCFHICSLTSFTIPYMSPIAPLNLEGMKDSLVRFPFESMKTRPEGIANDKKRRGD
ncbi:MAG: spore germination protein [Clostridiaceae bacterium]